MRCQVQYCVRRCLFYVALIYVRGLTDWAWPKQGAITLQLQLILQLLFCLKWSNGRKEALVIKACCC